jgi:hypothetical protein
MQPCLFHLVRHPWLVLQIGLPDPAGDIMSTYGQQAGLHSGAVLRATRFIRVDFPHTPSASARPSATTCAKHPSGLRRYVITSLSFEVCSLCFPFFRYHALARAKLAPDEAVRPAGSRVRHQASVDFKGHTPTQQ